MLVLWDNEPTDSKVFIQTCARFMVAAGILALVGNGKTFAHQQDRDDDLQGLGQYEVVHPSKVDAVGRFVSHSLSHHVSRLHRRDTSSHDGGTRVFYQLRHGRRDLLFNLTFNPHLLAPGFVTERRYGGLTGAKIRTHVPSLCYFTGEVWDEVTFRGRAAVSTCNGLTGLFKLSEEDFFIRPVEPVREQGVAQAHVIYKRHAPAPLSHSYEEHRVNGTCGVKDSRDGGERAERRRERWERRQQRRRIRQRSISREKWVETLVVADPKMVQYHGSQQVETYVLTVMNIVAGLFHDASIGNSIHIVVVRLILLEEEEEGLKITHHADNSLNSFCRWQKNLNVKGDEHPVHHDVAVLITRKDICAAMNKPCETLGLSHVAGMCQPHRSCSINEDTGLPLAFTVAHELGHNFGIQHDGNGNDCEPIGKRPFIMSPQLLYGITPPNWSRCSRQYITRFLDRGWGLCLDDPPVRDELEFSTVPPGVLYSAAHQCRLQYGSSSQFCDDVDDVCSTLWCTVGNTCHSKLDGAADGTNCGLNKWCFDGECVPVGYRPESLNGGWSSWSVWSACSRTCGAGVQNAERECNNPVPKFGGKYCLGERRRYRVCNTDPCPAGLPSFRHIQCSHFNTMPYKGKLYKWVPVNNRANPCELHCRPQNEYFSDKLLDAAVDGTRCYEGSSSRDTCINGFCKNVGCDYEIDSNAVEDRCGVCHGNGSTCETVKKTFEESEGLGYVDVGLIPEGARDIRIEEVAEAGNFLALRSEDPDRYFLNGGWTIQWNGDYKAAGTTFTYERTGNLENLTSPGPTLEPVWIQLLFQETNPGVRYEYTIQREAETNNEIATPDFFWQYGSWTECSATCGTGVQRQIVHCVERTAGIVEEQYCDPATRPDDKQASCNEELCPARWWAGEWQKCSASCGDEGLMKRTVLCVQSVGADEQRALQPSECENLTKPESVAPCNTQPCPADWTVGNWSECSVTCGGGNKSRDVICSRNTGADCDPKKKPPSETPCNAHKCPKKMDIFGTDWSGSGSSSKELYNEINSILDGSLPPKPGQGTTKARPPEYADLNNIIEDDFSIQNHIDQTGEDSFSKNVFVDDFYYDYNFINFHVDLSYGLGIEKEDDKETETEENMGTNREGEGHDHSSGTTDNIDQKSANAELHTVSPKGPEDLHSTIHPLNCTEIELDRKEADEINPEMSENEGEEDDKFYSFNYLLPDSSPTRQTSVTVTPSFLDSEEESNEGSPTERPSSSPLTYSPDKVHTESFSLGEPELEDHFSSSLVNFTANTEAENNRKHQKDGGKNNGHPMEDLWTEGDLNDSSDAGNPHGLTEDRMEDQKVYTADERNGTSDRDFGSHEQAVTSFPTENEEGGTLDINENQESVLTSEEIPDAQKILDQTEGDLPPLTPHPWFYLKTETPLPTVPDQFDLMSIVGHTSTQFFKEQDPDPNDKTETPLYNEMSKQPDISPEAVTSPPYVYSQTLPSALPASWDPALETSASPEWDKKALHPIVQEEDAHTVLISTGTTSDEASTASPDVHRPSPGVTKVPDQMLTSPPSSTAVWSEIDSNEIINPYLMRSRITQQPVTDHPDNDNSSLPEESSRPLGLTQFLSSPTPAPDTAGFWVAGKWSACSTSCGLGAVWRTVTCSTGRDVDCDITERPPPARRCYLRPCSAWRVTEWGKCSQNCGGGEMVREIQCFDTRDRRPLRPFHCRAVSHKPPALGVCNAQSCLDWYTSSWGECSELCGGGEQQRFVTCPEMSKCDDSLQPSNVQSCNTHPCTKWVLGSWGQCSASCGGGLQRRLVKCVNTKTGQEEEDRAQCDHEPWPENTQECNTQDCESVPPSQPCQRDRLTFRFCQTLKWLGRCQLPTVRAQCCQTCGSRTRGNERTARR
nr:PREDICTED: A disintegrin and metalloproteinase with thrombospondin motifs 7-like [Lepisosteus oculatus]